MTKACPVSLKQIDANIARINSFFITLGIVAFLYFDWTIVPILLAVDFFIRLFLKPNYSYIVFLSKIIKKIFHIRTKMTDQAPKRVAAFFGLFFTISISVGSILGYHDISHGIAYILLFCSSLELFFNYCLGCQIYHLYQYVIKYTRSANLKNR
jgi:hypothetical protein